MAESRQILSESPVLQYVFPGRLRMFLLPGLVSAPLQMRSPFQMEGLERRIQ